MVLCVLVTLCVWFFFWCLFVFKCLLYCCFVFCFGLWCVVFFVFFFFSFCFSSRRRHTGSRTVSWARRCVAETAMTRACQNCPSFIAYDGEHCGDCGGAYAAARECKPCARIGLQKHSRNKCGARTTLPYIPNAMRCACAEPTSSEAWCTICGGKSYCLLYTYDAAVE